MSASNPNHVKFQRGEVVTGFDFGDVLSVTPIHYTSGLGHTPHVRARLEGGVRIDWTPQSLVSFIRLATEALAKLPQVPDIPDHVGGDE